MPEEMQLVMPDLTSEVRTLAHPVCNGDTCTETGPFTCLRVPVACTKLDIFRYSNEMRKGLDCVCCVVPPCVLETRPYDVFEIIPLILIGFFWDKEVTRGLDSRPLRWKRLLF